MEKLESLKQNLLKIGQSGLCVAFSGGVDSTLILKAAVDLLGEKVTAVTFSSRLSPKTEMDEAAKLAENIGAKHFVLQFDEFEDEKIITNPVDRCYHCKSYIFSSLKRFCRENNLGEVADGTNFDDLSQYRPGLQALRELNIHSPLAECGFTKAEVRECARELGLTVHSKPSAPCMATRVPYGTRLTDELLKRIERSEETLKALGFSGLRVRAHGDIARIELPKDQFQSAVRKSEMIAQELKKAGFNYVTLDLEGFRSGSMDIHIRK